jgi:DNA-binding protein Fis
MKLKELRGHVYDDVCVYSESSNGIDYDNLYEGSFKEIDKKLLECEVGVIGFNARKCVLDIEVRRENKHHE